MHVNDDDIIHYQEPQRERYELDVLVAEVEATMKTMSDGWHEALPEDINQCANPCTVN